MLKVDVDMTKLDTAIAEYASAAKISLADAIKEEAKQVVTWLIQRTPPRQAAQGRSRVEEDIRRLFRPAEEGEKIKILMAEALLNNYFAIDPKKLNLRNIKMQSRIESLWMRKDKQALEAIFRNWAAKRIRKNTFYEKEATEQIHDQHRTKKGGTRKSHIVIVEKVRSINRLVARKRAHVGTMKAGWVVAANALGVSVPGWIQKNAQPRNGSLKDDTTQLDKPSITIGNRAPGIKWNDYDHKLVARVAQARIKALQTKARVALRLAKRQAKLA